MKNSSANRYGNSLCPVVYLQFRENILDVALHSFFTNIQICADLFISHAFRNKLQHFDLSRRQRPLVYAVGQFPANFRRNRSAAGMHLTNNWY